LVFILGNEGPQSAGGNQSSPNVTPKTPRKMVRNLKHVSSLELTIILDMLLIPIKAFLGEDRDKRGLAQF